MPRPEDAARGVGDQEGELDADPRDRGDRLQLHRDGGDDCEGAAAAATQRPEVVGVGALVGGDLQPAREDRLALQDVVHDQPICRG